MTFDLPLPFGPTIAVKHYVGAHAKYTIHTQVSVQEIGPHEYLVKWSYNAFARIRFEVLQDQLPNHQPPLRREGCSGLFHCLLSLA